MLQFQVRKNELATTRIVSIADAALVPGSVRVRVEQFAYTANNITYAAFGEAMNYWQFFPVSDDAAGWGVVPVWGFGTVVQSQHPGVAVGERLYGYWPTATHAVLHPMRMSPAHFFDGAAHRTGLHAVYNQYLRCSADPLYRADSEALQALLRPLFLTAWLIDDFLADNGFFGITAAARRGALLLSSASSKTAYATAAQLAARPGVEVIGLTSPANVSFCESLGTYHRVLRYDQLDAVAADTPCIYIDFAGSAPLRKAIHERFGALAHSSAIGGTHVSELGGGQGLPGPRPVLFFAPAQAKKRHADWGATDFNARLSSAWHAFVEKVNHPGEPWLVVQEHRGPAGVQHAHSLVLEGRGDPRHGHMLSMQA